MRYIYHGTYQAGSGAVIQGGIVKVYKSGTDTLATIYTLSAGGSAVDQANSPLTTDTNGHFYFYVDDTDYPSSQLFKVVLTATNFIPSTYDDIRIIAATTGYDYVVDASEADHGVTGGGDTLKAHIDAIGSAERTIYFPPGAYTLTTSLTVPSNITLKPAPGAVLDGAGTLTGDNAKLDIGLHLFFGSSVAVDGTWNIEEAYPEWFGSVAGTSDSSATTQRALNFSILCGVPLNGNNNEYSIGTTITRTSAYSYLGLKDIKFKAHASLTTDWIADFGSAAGGLGAKNTTLNNVIFDGNHQSKCLRIQNHFQTKIDGLKILRYKTSGFELGYGTLALEGSIENVFISQYENLESGYNISTNYDGIGFTCLASDFTFYNFVFAYNNIGTYITGGSNRWIGCHWYGSLNANIQLDGALGCRRNVFIGCWINGRVVLLSPHLACDHVFTGGCIIKHDDIWTSGGFTGGTTWDYIFSLNLNSASSAVNGLVITGNLLDGQSAVTSADPISVVSGTVTSYTSCLFGPNTYVNSMKGIAEVLSTVAATGNLISENGAVCVGGKKRTSGQFQVHEGTSGTAVFSDIVGYDASGTVGGFRNYNNTLGTYTGMMHKTGGVIQFEADDGTFYNLMQLSPSTPSGQTAMLIMNDPGTGLRLSRVSLGIADSGGVGFKVLRIPN